MADIKNNLNNAANSLKEQEKKNQQQEQENRMNYERFVNNQNNKSKSDEIEEKVMDNSNQKDYTEYVKKDDSVFGDNFLKKDSISGYLLTGVIGNQFLPEQVSKESKEKEIAGLKEDKIVEKSIDTKNEKDIIGEPFSDTKFDSKIEPKIEVSLNQETLEKRINGQSLKDVLTEINKEKLSEQDKVKFYNQFVDASKEHEQKYKIKSLEEPLSLNLNDQINAIMNSNLKELGDTRSLKVYQTLNKDGKALEGRPELEAAVKDNIKSVIEGYNKGTINENTNGFKIAFNGEDPYRKYPKELLKNADGAPTKDQLDWLNKNIKDNDLSKNVEKYLKEDQYIFRDSLKNTMKEYNELNKTITMTEKLAAEGKFPQEKVNYLKEARAEIEPTLNEQINKRLKDVGFDLEANLERDRKVAELAEKQRLEAIEKDKYDVNEHTFTDEDRESMYR